LIVPLPMLVTLVTRRVPDPEGWRRAKAWGTTIGILGLVALSVYAGVVSDGPLLARLR